MESRVWLNIQEKAAYILGLRGDLVYTLRIRGLLLKSKARGIAEKLEAGADPGEVGGKLAKFDVRSIGRASVAPGNGSLKLVSQAGPSLSYSTADSDADAILAEILARTGREFRPMQEGVSVVEAAIPPVFTGAIAGLFWALILDAAQKHAMGQEIEIKGRRRGLQRMTVLAADVLGYNGVLAVGALLGAAIVAWLVSRLVKRPQRTVWLPA